MQTRTVIRWAFSTAVILVLFATLPSVFGDMFTPQPVDVPWSVEIFPDNPESLHFKLDASNIMADGYRGFGTISFDIDYFSDAESQMLIAREQVVVPPDIVNKLVLGGVSEFYLPNAHSDAVSVNGADIHATVIPLGTEFLLTIKPLNEPRLSAAITSRGVGLNRPPKAGTTSTVGNLFWYRDAGLSGAGTVSNPKIVGHGGWQQFKTVFSAGSGAINAITASGDLLRYKDAGQQGMSVVANRTVIGHGGWQQYKTVFSGGPGVLYAITANGDLLWYRDSGLGGIGAVANAKVVGHGGWQRYKIVFSGGPGVLYAVTVDGDLLWYRDAGQQGTSIVANPKVVGRGGWQLFKQVFAGGNGVLYAVTANGDLLWYRDAGPNGMSTVINPKIVGHGGWQRYKTVFSANGGALYAITEN